MLGGQLKRAHTELERFYAAVLDDGNLVRPVPVSRYAYHPVRRSREKWGAPERKRNGNRVVEFSEKPQSAEGWAVLD